MEEVSPKDAFQKFIPYSFVFVISVDKNNNPGGMIAAWQTKLSYNPPLFGVCLAKSGYTHKLIQESKEFVIAVPNKGLEKEVRLFGSTHGNEVDKFKETGIKTQKAKHINSPLLADATINLECKLENQIDVGDHILFIGRVLAGYTDPDKKILFQVKKVGNEGFFEEF